MNRLSDADVLTIWERGSAQHAIDRALTALAVASGTSPRRLADLAIGERDARLFALYQRSFGLRIDVIASCPACADQVELALEVDQLCPPGEHCAVAEPQIVELDGVTVTCRQPTSRDLAAAATAASTDDARAVLLLACTTLASCNGRPIEVAMLGPEIVARIEHALADMSPPAERTLAMSCPACSHVWSAPFDVAEALWAKIDRAARQLMEAVAGLAERYGWSEADTLALPPARRHYYLERPAS